VDILATTGWLATGTLENGFRGGTNAGDAALIGVLEDAAEATAR
jgi:hypothetical protein